MIEMKTNTEEGSCEMSIEGELGDAMYDVLIFSNAMLKFFEGIDPSISMGFSEIMVEYFQDYLDGNLEPSEIAEHEQIHIDGEAMKVLQELLEAQSGDAA